jgi:hypothetical protein
MRSKLDVVSRKCSIAANLIASMKGSIRRLAILCRNVDVDFFQFKYRGTPSWRLRWSNIQSAVPFMRRFATYAYRFFEALALFVRRISEPAAAVSRLARHSAGACCRWVETITLLGHWIFKPNAFHAGVAGLSSSAHGEFGWSFASSLSSQPSHRDKSPP